jgi:hypothetical protein
MRMLELRYHTRFLAKMLDFIGREAGIKYFDGGTGAKVDMLAQIDVSKSPVPKQSSQPIMTNVLTAMVGHTKSS